MEIHTKPTTHADNTNDTHTQQQTGTWSRSLQAILHLGGTLRPEDGYVGGVLR